MIMKPYYQDGAVTIYLGDCGEILPSIPKVDLVLTDPPYGIGADKHHKRPTGGKAVAPKRDYGNSEWDSSTPSPETMLMVLAAAPNLIIWGGNYFALAPRKSWLVWDKLNGDNPFADCELAWTNLDIVVRKFTYRWMGMLQQNMAEKEVRVHPTQKPTELMRWCINLVPYAETILDPFMGSGTTLRAAKDLGRKAIGIEINEAYAEIAARRMQQEVLPLTTTPTPHKPSELDLV